jgi:hypothetical protein
MQSLTLDRPIRLPILLEADDDSPPDWIVDPLNSAQSRRAAVSGSDLSHQPVTTIVAPGR